MRTRLDLAYEIGSRKISLSKLPIVYAEHNLFDVRFEPESDETPEGYQDVKQLRSVQRELEIKLQIRDRPRNRFYQVLDELNDIIERSPNRSQPGRLWCNGRYIRCWPISADLDQMSMIDLAKIMLTFLPVAGVAWTHEDTVKLSPSSAVTSTGGFKFPLRWPFKFGSNRLLEIVNPAATSSHFALTFFGPAENPALSIGSAQRGAMVSLNAGDQLIIDSRQRTVEVITDAGVRHNAFDKRIRTSGLFARIPTGRLSATLGGNYTAQLTLYGETATPRWAEVLTDG